MLFSCLTGCRLCLLILCHLFMKQKLRFTWETFLLTKNRCCPSLDWRDRLRQTSALACSGWHSVCSAQRAACGNKMTTLFGMVARLSSSVAWPSASLCDFFHSCRTNSSTHAETIAAKRVKFLFLNLGRTNSGTHAETTTAEREHMTSISIYCNCVNRRLDASGPPWSSLHACLYMTLDHPFEGFSPFTCLNKIRPGGMLHIDPGAYSSRPLSP